MSWCIRMAFSSDKKTWLKKSDFLNLKIWLNLSDFFYKKNQNFLFFFYNNKRVVEIYHQNFIFVNYIRVKKTSKEPLRDGVHFSYWSRNTKKNKKSGRDSGWNFSLRIRWFIIILLIVFCVDKQLFLEIILRSLS